MAAQGLKSVMKNRRVAAIFETHKKFEEGSGGLVADAREVGNGDEFERHIRDVHQKDSSILAT
jgi:hypothetical protein